MGYYENPPIIVDNSSQHYSNAISNAAAQMTQIIAGIGERRRQEEKEQKLTLQKVLDRKNEVDLFYNEKMSDWSIKQTNTASGVVNTKIKDFVKQAITKAADSRIRLINETDPTLRDQYLGDISKAEALMDNASKATSALATQSAGYRLQTPASLMGRPGGQIVAGKTKEEIENNQFFLDAVSGMGEGNKRLYKDGLINLDVNLDESGTSFLISANAEAPEQDVTLADGTPLGYIDPNTGQPYKRKGTAYSKVINTAAYLDSEANKGGDLLSKIESLDTYNTESNKLFMKDGQISENFLTTDTQTIPINSKGKEKYQMRNARALNINAIKTTLMQPAKVKAAGLLSAGDPQVLQNFVNYTLGKGTDDVEYFQKTWPTLTTLQQQQDFLTNMIVDQGLDGVTANFQKTGTKGKEDYKIWDPRGDVGLVPKPEKVGGGTDNEEQNKQLTELLNDPRTKEFNKLFSTVSIKGADGKINRAASAYRQRQQDASVLNKIIGGKGQKLFMTRDELFERWKKTSVTEGTEKKPVIVTNAQRLKRDGKKVMNEFNKSYPGKTSIFVKEGGVYVEPEFDTKSREGLVDLALSLSGEGGIKKFGAFSRAGTSADEEIRDETIASLKEEYPKGANESLEVYSKRIAQLYNQTK